MQAEGAALARLAASYARGPGDGEDLFQDIAVAIWQALPRFRGECSERTFLFRIAHNRGIAHVARRRLPTIDAGEDVELADKGPDPEQKLSVEQQGRQPARGHPVPASRPPAGRHAGARRHELR